MNSLSGVLKGNEFNVVNLGVKDLRTYLFGLVFIAGNVLLPWMCHQFALGGPMFLPIYFFALIAGYKFGYKVGLLTAVASPLANFLLTGMPPVTSIPIIVLKSSLLAISAALVANYSKRISIINVILVVFMYQLISSAIIFMVTKNSMLAISDVIIGYPGLILQVIGGYLILNKLNSLDLSKTRS